VAKALVAVEARRCHRYYILAHQRLAAVEVVSVVRMPLLKSWRRQYTPMYGPTKHGVVTKTFLMCRMYWSGKSRSNIHLGISIVDHPRIVNCWKGCGGEALQKSVC